MSNTIGSGTNSQGKTKAEEITDILRDEILTGQYRPGERMPSERDLAARFEASRGAVRESLKKLEQLGIASITPGGVRVVPIKEASLAVLGPLIDLQPSPDPTMSSHVFEVIGALMSMAARTAVERASEAELLDMRDIIKDIIAHSGDTPYQNNRWRDLGMMFTEVSENLVLRLILNGLKTQVFDRTDGRPQIIFDIDQDAHREILMQLQAATEQRDSAGAANAILDHFQFINQTLQLALSGAGDTQQSSSL